MALRIRLVLFSLLLGCGVLSLSSCDGYEKVLKNPDVNYKLAKANEYFDKKQWSKANELYRSLLPVLKGTRNYEPLYFRYAYTYWYMKDYLNSSYHFRNFADFFPSSKDAEEAEYLYAVSLWKESPKPSLMQANTIRAKNALQEFASNYPNSKYLPEVRLYLDEADSKLEQKDVLAAKLYYNIGEYKAAAVYYTNILNDYPDSDHADEYQYMIVKSLYFYARNSLVDKQPERYANALSEYQEFKTRFPKSKFNSDAARYQSLASAALAKSNNQ